MKKNINNNIIKTKKKSYSNSNNQNNKNLEYKNINTNIEEKDILKHSNNYKHLFNNNDQLFQEKNYLMR